MRHLLANFVKVLGIMLLSGSAAAEVKVIVHSSIADDSITAIQLMDIYLGKAANLPSGQKIKPIDQADGELARTEFYQKVIKKDAAQLNAYWARLIFTGKGQPPKMLTDNSDVLQQVSSNADMIGYVGGSANTSNVKVLFTIR